MSFGSKEQSFRFLGLRKARVGGTNESVKRHVSIQNATKTTTLVKSSAQWMYNYVYLFNATPSSSIMT